MRYRIPLLLILAFAFTPSLSAATYAAAATGEGRSSGYREATRALDEARWDDAIRGFEAVAAAGGSDTDAALYWKAYAESRAGRRAESRATVKVLQERFPESVWLDDAAALNLDSNRGAIAGIPPVPPAPGVPPAPPAPPMDPQMRSATRAVIAGGSGRRDEPISEEEELQLYALDGLMQTNSARALPILEKILASDKSMRIKERALFVLGQSDSPRAREVLVETARSGRPEELQLLAVRSLGIAGDALDTAALSEIYRSTSSIAVKSAVLEGLMIAGETKPILAAAKGENNPELRGKAIEMLGVSNASAALTELYASTPQIPLKEKILQGLMISGDGKAMIALLRKETNPELKKSMVRYLGLMDDDDATDELLRILGESK
ncbi:MAG: HEAT repeat domain-containing protein [Thermoanaerobaculia bacterium]